MATLRVITALFVTLCMTSSLCDASSMDISRPYYDNVVLDCNETASADMRFAWILPDATVIQHGDVEFPKRITRVNVTAINVTKIDDELFGYYTCVMTSNSSEDISITRWGLNVDGADFSELEKQYKESAIIGAIAAGVMLVVVGGACVIWNYRYSKRARSEDGGSSIEDDLKKPSGHTYSNQAFDGSRSVNVADVDITENGREDTKKSNGSPATVTVAVTDNGQGSENFRM